MYKHLLYVMGCLIDQEAGPSNRNQAGQIGWGIILQLLLWKEPLEETQGTNDPRPLHTQAGFLWQWLKGDVYLALTVEASNRATTDYH